MSKDLGESIVLQNARWSLYSAWYRYFGPSILSTLATSNGRNIDVPTVATDSSLENALTLSQISRAFIETATNTNHYLYTI